MYTVPWVQCLTLAACALHGQIAWPAEEPFSRQEGGAEANQVICGPRAVRFVLSQLGKKAHLADLVREIQWPDIGEGATLDAMQASLEKRGVHTLALQVPRGDVPDWPHPVIVHVNAPNLGMGHYLVVLPGLSRTSRRVWDGLDEADGQDPGEVLSRMTGAILLTSPEAFSHEDIPLDRTGYRFDVHCLLLAVLDGVAGIAAWVYCSSRFIWSKKGSAKVG